MTKPFIIDLFSGCGGFGLGAKLAGFDVRIAIDFDKDLQSSYSLNFPSTDAKLKDIGKITAEDWQEWLGDDRPDGIIGGPPCQGYSRIGKRDKNDPRNALVAHFFRHIELLRPKFFIMENVEGLLDEGTVDSVMTSLQGIARFYTVLDPMVINAADYGAPTDRKRVVIIGYDKARMAPISIADVFAGKRKRKVTVRSAIGDLPEPLPGSAKLKDYCYAELKEYSNFKVSKYAKALRALPPEGMGNKEAIEQLKKGYVSGFHLTDHTPEVAARYAAVKPGMVDKTSKSSRLEWQGQCKTLRAGTGSDKGSFQAVRPLHPEVGRVITVREAARLQGFPDWFLFHQTKWHSFRMIGNSVSPIVSKALLDIVRSKLVLKKAA